MKALTKALLISAGLNANYYNKLDDLGPTGRAYYNSKGKRTKPSKKKHKRR